MIEIIPHSVFNSDCEALVNTVNCEGVMGAGLALEYKLRYPPEMFNEYTHQCKTGLLSIGILTTYKVENGPLIVNFPTKKEWRKPSKISYIEEGLVFLRDHYKDWNISSIAIPPLGCTNGKLDFEKSIKPLMIHYLEDLDINVKICIDPVYPEGTEQLMIELFHQNDPDELCKNLGIPKKQSEKIVLSASNITRMYQIRAIKGITESSYAKIFKYLLDKSVSKSKPEFVKNTVGPLDNYLSD